MRTLASWARGGGRPGSRLTLPTDVRALARGWGVGKRRVPLGAPAQSDARPTHVDIEAPHARLPRFDIDVVGLELLAGQARPVIVVANHASGVDPTLLGQVLPTQWLVRTSGATLALRSGRSVLLFPEGEPTTDGTLGEFSPRAAALSLRHGVPIVPVTIRGSYGMDALPPRTSSGALPRVLVRFGAPIEPTGDNPDVLIEIVRDSVQALLTEDAGNWYASLRGVAEPVPVTGWRAVWAAQEPVERPGSRERRRIWGRD